METELSSDKKRLIETFSSITSSSPQEAYFFLESHNWDLDSAASTFFEHQQNPLPPLAEPIPVADPELTTDPPIPIQRSTVGMASSSSPSRDTKKKLAAKNTSKIRTLADLNNDHGDHDHGSDSDSDAPQEYYTGGEKSGMLVQGPPKGNNDVESIFSQARKLGAMDGPATHVQPSSSSSSFTGTGRLLSGEPAPSATPEVPQPPESVVHSIVFWSNGFTVNDGPLRSIDDPENAPFLESIKRSECPQELAPADRRTQVKVNLIQREGNCPERETRHVPFQGVGRTLGSSTEAPAATEPTVVAAPLNAARSPSVGLVVDATLPSTSIQLRLADGTRMVARFNYHHTVSDIRAFIDASRPGSARTYHLQTVGFPPKQLTDVSQTIEQAGLGNSVVIQKL